MDSLIDTPKIQVTRLALGSFKANAYVLICKASKESIVIDAPGEADKIKEALKGTKPQKLLLTHTHPDHIGALDELREWGLSVHAHPEDTANISVDALIKDGDRIPCGKVNLTAIHTPGHTPGGMCFYLEPYLFSGDTIFPGGPGRTSCSENFDAVIHSIAEKIFKLPQDTVIFPGHGTETTIEKEYYAFNNFIKNFRNPGLYGEVTWSGTNN